MAIICAVKTSNAPDPTRLRIVRIPNTLHLEHILISEALMDEAQGHAGSEILGEAAPCPFDPAGTLTGA